MISSLEKNNNQITIKHKSSKLPDTIGKINKVTGNSKEVLPQTDLFVIAVPAVAHQYYFQEMQKIKNSLKQELTFGVLVA